jgi:hypothetical protein
MGNGKSLVILLNFSHPLTLDQRAQIESLTGQKLEQLIEISVEFDHQRPFRPQVDSLLNAVSLTPAQWQGTPLLVNLPSLSAIASLVVAALHGRMGYFPAVIRLRPVDIVVPTRFEVAEILDLQAVRDQARLAR